MATIPIALVLLPLLATACTPKAPTTLPDTPAATSIPASAPAAGGPIAAAGVTLPAYQTIALPNGATLLLAARHDVPLIAFTAIMRGGALADPEGKAGTAAVLAEVLQKGAGDRPAAAFAEALDGVGGSLSVTVRREFIEIGGEFLAEDGDLMVELLSDVLRRPALADDEIVKVRDRAVETITASKDGDLGALVDVYGHAILFGPEHPYGRPIDGSEASLGGVTPADVRDYYAGQFGGDRLILAMVGDFDPAAMVEKLDAALGDWPAAAGPPPAAPPAMPARTGRQVLVVDAPDATQTYFWLGNVGVSRTDPDTPVIDLADTVLGGRFTSLLNTALRIDSGLTYGAYSVLTRPSAPHSAAIVSSTETESTAKAVDMALDVLGKYRAEGMDDAVLASAKAYTLGQFPLELETGDDIAARLARNAFYGLGDDDVNDYGARIGAATKDEVNAVIARVYPAPEDLAIVLIGNADTIRATAEKYGPVTEMALTDPEFAPAGE